MAWAEVRACLEVVEYFAVDMGDGDPGAEGGVDGETGGGEGE